MPSCCPHAPVSRASAYAAGTARRSVMATTAAPAIVVFQSQRR